MGSPSRIYYGTCPAKWLLMGGPLVACYLQFSLNSQLPILLPFLMRDLIFDHPFLMIGVGLVNLVVY